MVGALDIVSYWQKHAEDLGLDQDDLENPNCFACGIMPSDLLGYISNTTEFGKGAPKVLRWSDQTRLQRAHIVAKSLGGEDTAENILMLCDLCHKESPDINDRELVLRWVRNRPSHFVRMTRDMDDAFLQLGYPNWRDIPYFKDPINFSDALKIGAATTTEWITHGSKLSIATGVALVVKRYEDSREVD